MTTEPRLESYLTSLDRSLASLPLSDRAEIVTEVKHHIRDARERDPGQDIDILLASFGDPDVVASRYLTEESRGMRQAPASPRGLITKWVTIAFLGSFVLVLFFLGGLAWKFSSWLSPDEGRSNVSALTELMDVDSKGSARFRPGDRQSFKGRKHIDPGSFDQVGIQFTNAKLEVSTSKAPELRWSCEYLGAKQSDLLKEDTQTKALLFTLGHVAAVECDLQIPQGIRVAINGANAQIAFDEPRFDLDVRVTNGQVDFSPHRHDRYNYDVKVTNGAVDAFTSTGQGADAYQIMIRLTNGQVEKQQ